MRITPCSVHDENTRVLAHGLGECLGTLLDDDVAPADLAREGRVERRALGVFAVDKFGDVDLVPEAGFAGLALDRGAVDGEVSEVSEELLSTVLALNELEPLGSIVDELEGVSGDALVRFILELTVVQVLPPMKTS